MCSLLLVCSFFQFLSANRKKCECVCVHYLFSKLNMNSYQGLWPYVLCFCASKRSLRELEVSMVAEEKSTGFHWPNALEMSVESARLKKTMPHSVLALYKPSRLRGRTVLINTILYLSPSRCPTLDHSCFANSEPTKTGLGECGFYLYVWNNAKNYFVFLYSN